MSESESEFTRVCEAAHAACLRACEAARSSDALVAGAVRRLATLTPHDQRQMQLNIDNMLTGHSSDSESDESASCHSEEADEDPIGNEEPFLTARSRSSATPRDTVLSRESIAPSTNSSSSSNVPSTSVVPDLIEIRVARLSGELLLNACLPGDTSALQIKQQLVLFPELAEIHPSVERALRDGLRAWLVDANGELVEDSVTVATGTHTNSNGAGEIALWQLTVVVPELKQTEWAAVGAMIDYDLVLADLLSGPTKAFLGRNGGLISRTTTNEKSTAAYTRAYRSAKKCCTLCEEMIHGAVFTNSLEQERHFGCVMGDANITDLSGELPDEESSLESSNINDQTSDVVYQDSTGRPLITVLASFDKILHIGGRRAAAALWQLGAEICGLGAEEGEKKNAENIQEAKQEEKTTKRQMPSFEEEEKEKQKEAMKQCRNILDSLKTNVECFYGDSASQRESVRNVLRGALTMHDPLYVPLTVFEGI